MSRFKFLATLMQCRLDSNFCIRIIANAMKVVSDQFISKVSFISKQKCDVSVFLQNQSPALVFGVEEEEDALINSESAISLPAIMLEK